MARKLSASAHDRAIGEAQKAIGFQLSRVMAVLRREVDMRMQTYGLTHAQWRPLWLLKMGLARTTNELARELDVDTSAVTRLIDRLEAKHLVARTRSGEDRRVVYLALTRDGEQAVSHIPGVLAEVNTALLSGFTAAETAQLRDMLQRMQRNGGETQSTATATPPVKHRKVADRSDDLP